MTEHNYQSHLDIDRTQQTKIKIHYQDFIELFLLCFFFAILTAIDYFIINPKVNNPFMPLIGFMFAFMGLTIHREWKFITREVRFE